MTRKREWVADSVAFSLVELMVTVAIIAVLAALLLPAVSRSRQAAQKIQCVGNLRQLGVGLQSFVAGNHVYPTLFGGTNNGDQSYAWMDQLERGGFDISQPKKSYSTEGVWKCPSARWSMVDPPSFTNCYSYNGCGISGLNPRDQYLGLSGQPISRVEGFRPIKESEVIAPGDMMAIGDSFAGDYVFGRGGVPHMERVGFASSRHAGKVNVVFCDGHVESPSLKIIFADTNDAVLVRWNRDHLPHRERL